MGMIEGAVIGGISGGAAVLVMVWRQAQWQKRLLKTLADKGHDAARALLDKHAPTLKPQRSFPLRKLIVQRARINGLTILGDGAEIQRELAQHGGSANYKFQVHAFGLLGLALQGDDVPGRARELEELARQVDAEANALQKILKDRMGQVARLGKALTGQPLSAADATAIQRWAHADPILTRVVLFRALDVAAQKSGAPDPRYRAVWRALTTAFES